MLRWGAIGGRLRCVAFAWAILAVILKVGVPPGFMLSGETRTLVPCPVQFSGVMPSMADMPDMPRMKAHGQADPAREKNPGAEAPCTCSTHSAALLAAIVETQPPGETFNYVISPPVLPAGVVHGQVLAAPPLPARGPPSVERISTPRAA